MVLSDGADWQVDSETNKLILMAARRTDTWVLMTKSLSKDSVGKAFVENEEIVKLRPAYVRQGFHEW